MLEARLNATEATVARLVGLLLTTAQKRRIGAFLAAVAGVNGSNAWTVGDAFASTAPGIVLTRGSNRHALGRLLALAQDVPIDAYVLRDAGHEHGARRWSIEGVRRVG